MYRQILIAPEDRNLQRIIWRYDLNSPIKHYKLNTVTYGTSSAPFLATRCLVQLAEDNKVKFPEASEAISSCFYVDDLLAGEETIESCILLKNQIQTILSGAGMNLCKWVSNCEQICSTMTTRISEVNDFNLTNNSHKTLGLYWNNDLDTFTFKVKFDLTNDPLSKRSFLSLISQIFDPLGLLSPVLIKHKILMQQIWTSNISWNENIPKEIHEDFNVHLAKICVLNDIKIERHVLTSLPIDIQMHGFCDASERAYGACIYIRSINAVGDIKVSLVCSKSRVAPLKKLSIPRLELCSALLLANLVNYIKINFKRSFSKIVCWSDSMVTLHWIHGEPNRWNTFVANRVSEIQKLSKNHYWKHVLSAENPADMISRSISPENLINNQLWWSGPKWLTQTNEKWPSINIYPSETIPETKKIVSFLTTVEFDLFFRYSSLSKLLRTVSYIRRMYFNKKHKCKIIGQPSVLELDESLISILKIAQQQSFPTEYKDLLNKNTISKSSKILNLNPIFVKNLIRVGGRIGNALISEEQKHPILIDSKHILTTLIIRDYHLKNLHLGTQSLLYLMRLKYWLLNGTNTIKGTLRKCITCFKSKPIIIDQLMGDLPSSRIIPKPPFHHSGVDYAGPFAIKNGTLRNSKITKCYVCIFICFITKAVHMEVVSDLTSVAFLNCFKRFVARRGKPAIMWSDNGTNFVGANRELGRILQNLFSENSFNQIISYAFTEGIQWNFIPPRSPHMGGIWESAVKQLKYHLKRIINSVNLTFESLATVIAQIEACLNSRPLTPISNDPKDLNPLTPGHFLIGRPLLAIPQSRVMETTNIKHQYLQMIKATSEFWNRWSLDYISSLQIRNKWKQQKDNIKIGDLVVIKEEGLPTTAWALGRVRQVYPGGDGLIRVAELTTKNGITRRAISKLAVLPIDDNNLSSCSEKE
ncbi:uncharacterized protein LOC143918616 [Arctopsyche grandis]|uniref:uncharacterized protein LOC143918616 n=1 Tax=Arctopsyche grandis TaxID=121162 RepID=UPI00406D9BB5